MDVSLGENISQLPRRQTAMIIVSLVCDLRSFVCLWFDFVIINIELCFHSIKVGLWFDFAIIIIEQCRQSIKVRCDFFESIPS